MSGPAVKIDSVENVAFTAAAVQPRVILKMHRQPGRNNELDSKCNRFKARTKHFTYID